MNGDMGIFMLTSAENVWDNASFFFFLQNKIKRQHMLCASGGRELLERVRDHQEVLGGDDDDGSCTGV